MIVIIIRVQQFLYRMGGGLRPVFRFLGSRGHDRAVERLEAKNLGSMHDHLSAGRARAVKKTPPPTRPLTPRQHLIVCPADPSGATRGLCISLSGASRTQITESLHAVRIRAGFIQCPPGSTRVANCMGRHAWYHSFTQPLR